MTCRDTGSSPPLVSGFVLAWAWRHGKRLKLDLSVLIRRSIQTGCCLSRCRGQTHLQQALCRSYLINVRQVLHRPSILGKSDDLPIYEMSSRLLG